MIDINAIINILMKLPINATVLRELYQIHVGSRYNSHKAYSAHIFNKICNFVIFKSESSDAQNGVRSSVLVNKKNQD